MDTAPQVPPVAQAGGNKNVGAALTVAQALMILSDPKASEAAKGLAWARLGFGGLQYSGALDKGGAIANAFGPNAGPYLDGALSAAGFGLNLANIAGADTLTNKQKVGAGVQSGIDTAASYFFPAYGAAKLVQGVGQRLERSGSPEVRGLGRTIDYGIEPAGLQQTKAIFQGRQNFKDAWSEIGKGGGFAMDLALPGVNALLKGAGINVGVNVPTSEGGKFRQGVGKVFDTLKLPININFQDRSAYETMPALPGDQAKLAQQWGNDLAQLLQRPEYAGQLGNIVANNFKGDELQKQYDAFQAELVRRAQEQAAREREKGPAIAPGSPQVAAGAPQSRAGAAFNLYSMLAGMLRPNLGEV